MVRTWDPLSDGQYTRRFDNINNTNFIDKNKEIKLFYPYLTHDINGNPHTYTAEYTKLNPGTLVFNIDTSGYINITVTTQKHMINTIYPVYEVFHDMSDLIIPFREWTDINGLKYIHSNHPRMGIVPGSIGLGMYMTADPGGTVATRMFVVSCSVSTPLSNKSILEFVTVFRASADIPKHG